MPKHQTDRNSLICSGIYFDRMNNRSVTLADEINQPAESNTDFQIRFGAYGDAQLRQRSRTNGRRVCLNVRVSESATRM